MFKVILQVLLSAEVVAFLKKYLPAYGGNLEWGSLRNGVPMGKYMFEV